jgi:hypothetical protein
MINSRYNLKERRLVSNVKRHIGQQHCFERASCAEQAVTLADSPPIDRIIPAAGASACGFCFPQPQVIVPVVFCF